MTNGEKLKEVFPSIKLYEKSHDAIQINFDSVWWNAEYKEPTTKNDLAVDCISRADAIQAMQDKAKKLTNEDTINGLCGAVAILFDLPSVTPQEPRWIPVSERLPEEYKRVLVFDSWGGVYVGQYVDAEENWGGEHFINEAGMHSKTVVAWMPLPKSYSEVEK